MVPFEKNPIWPPFSRWPNLCGYVLQYTPIMVKFEMAMPLFLPKQQTSSVETSIEKVDLSSLVNLQAPVRNCQFHNHPPHW